MSLTIVVTFQPPNYEIRMAMGEGDRPAEIDMTARALHTEPDPNEVVRLVQRAISSGRDPGESIFVGALSPPRWFPTVESAVESVRHALNP